MHNLAPIVIFTYNRLNTLKEVIKSLKNNLRAKETTLYIFSDYAKEKKDLEEVNNVRKFLYTIDGFYNINIIERKENFGLAKNIIEGVTDIINKYDKVIVLEDDLITSPNFILYMNKALFFYEDNNQIFSISGYSGKLPSLNKIKNDVYLTYRPSSWGWSTWKNQWNSVDWDITDFDKFIKNREKIKKFNRGGIDMSRMLKHYIKGKNHSWAIRWAYSMSKQNKYCIYPKISKIQNIGFGDNATNCTGINIYQTDLDIGDKVEFKFDKHIKINKQLVKEFKYTFSYTNKLIKKIKYIYKDL